jgi:hypothetical protein
VHHVAGALARRRWARDARRLRRGRVLEAGTLAITSPSDGATVRTPFAVAVAVSGFKLQIAAQAESGVGHLHVIDDHPCIAPGNPIPVDDRHIHLWQGRASLNSTCRRASNPLR